jgi:hypothetical protein
MKVKGQSGRESDRRQECVVRLVGISGIVADDTVAVVVLAVEVWTVPKPASWNM